MFHVEHPTFSTMTFFLVFSPVFQAAQERSLIAGFSACGGPILRTNFLPLYSDPCGAFFMS